MSELCYNCFYEEAEGGICARCGYNASDDEGKFHNSLKHGSVLNGRYITGRVLHQGRCITGYMAQDYHTKELICIRECLPIPIVERSPRNEVVIMRPELAAEFHSIKTGLLSEAKNLLKCAGLSNVAHVRGFFEENGTAYMITDYVCGKSLAEYVNDSGGRLEPAEALKLLLPVAKTLAAMHDMKMIHRNIAPENIIITEGQTPVLVGFGESKTVPDTGYITLNEILSGDGYAGDKQQISNFVQYDGFAAVEQYSRNGRQSYYTDVYAFAAVLYFAITGEAPCDSLERMGCDELRLPGEYGINLGQKAENALMKALSVPVQDRYVTIMDFISDFKISSRSGPAFYRM